ncbi:hypothetical protein CI109_102987 [Kwoniella shandongensis]|uniref:chitin deacetylase n=1 Tax=Kwoniella shandongensis TaxID=1734106 RepID=A0A5M6C8J6_9TREE|nr:uncharacterized protein CI109_000174 [Kwoniella shandongensis]KAA5531333.1 hypothetical protein CI109_000174 [Kwoniella shandongensis]
MYGSSFLFPALSLLAAVSAAPLDETWLQPRDSPVSALFHKRYTPSPSDSNFTSNYPGASTTPPTNSLPAAWVEKLKSITLPGVSVSNPNNGYPQYANGESGGDQTICSFTYACTTKEDLFDPPANTLALSFDDGPTNFSPSLYDFLAKNNIASAATHFMIGGNILSAPTTMQDAVKAGGHIAVHTWSHPYMTTLSNEEILGELGWTMQIISDLNGGRIPKYWRPPFGDVDNRVRAIAKGVFGLETVVWNADSADWSIGSNAQYTLQSVGSMMDGFIAQNKSKGLMILEHELNDNTIGVFMTAYPKMVSSGWQVKNVADAYGMEWYVNSGKGNTDTVTTMSVAANTLAVMNSTSAESSTSAASASTTSGSAVSASTTSTSGSSGKASAVSGSATKASAAATSASAAAANNSATSSASALVSLGNSAYLLAVVGLVSAVLL